MVFGLECTDPITGSHALRLEQYETDPLQSVLRKK